MGRPKRATYRRSWKNLLLDKSYQLKFTLFMAGLSALLMALLGWWVIAVAKDATQLAVNNVEGAPCSEKVQAAADAPTPTKADNADMDPAPDEPPPTAAEPPAVDADPPVDGERKPAVVQIETSDMEIVKAPEPPAPDPAAIAAAKARFDACVDKQQGRIAELWNGFAMIKWLLVLFGFVLVGGLVVYGIKMTHKVAGPLFKVSLYLKKVRDNKYDTVYNLRKGDQLTDFYEHFKAAHKKLTSMQKQDIELLRSVIAAAEKHNLADKSPDIAEKLKELEAILEAKEKSIV